VRSYFLFLHCFCAPHILGKNEFPNIFLQYHAGARQPNMRLGHLRKKKSEKNKPQESELDHESPNNTRTSGIIESSVCESNSRTAGQLQQPSSSQLEGDRRRNDNDNACVDIDSTDAGSAGGIGGSKGERHKSVDHLVSLAYVET
jgi:hypothetical protein